MKGIRLPDGFDGTTPALTALAYEHIPKGSYWKESDGTWSVYTPNGRLGSIAKHTVVEHEDQTITVSPSILVYAVDGVKHDAATRAQLVKSHGEEQVQDWERGRPAWHGFLERGVWRDC